METSWLYYTVPIWKRQVIFWRYFTWLSRNDWVNFSKAETLTRRTFSRPLSCLAPRIIVTRQVSANLPCLSSLPSPISSTCLLTTWWAERTFLKSTANNFHRNANPSLMQSCSRRQERPLMRPTFVKVPLFQIPVRTNPSANGIFCCAVMESWKDCFWCIQHFFGVVYIKKIYSMVFPREFQLFYRDNIRSRLPAFPCILSIFFVPSHSPPFYTYTVFSILNISHFKSVFNVFLHFFLVFYLHIKSVLYGIRGGVSCYPRY